MPCGTVSFSIYGLDAQLRGEMRVECHLIVKRLSCLCNTQKGVTAISRYCRAGCDRLPRLKTGDRSNCVLPSTRWRRIKLSRMFDDELGKMKKPTKTQPKQTHPFEVPAAYYFGAALCQSQPFCGQEETPHAHLWEEWKLRHRVTSRPSQASSCLGSVCTSGNATHSVCFREELVTFVTCPITFRLQRRTSSSYDQASHQDVSGCRSLQAVGTYGGGTYKPIPRRFVQDG